MSSLMRWDTYRQKFVKRTMREIRDDAVSTMEMLERNIAKQEEYIELFAGETNPQIVRSRIEAEARRDAFRATLEALQGSKVMLSLYT